MAIKWATSIAPASLPARPTRALGSEANVIVVPPASQKLTGPSQAGDFVSTLGIKKPTLVAFGFGAGAAMPALDDVVRMSEGADALATAVNNADIRTSMASYYQHPSLAHTPGTPHVALSAPYIDSSGLGLVVTLSLPLYVPCNKQRRWHWPKA